MRMKLAVAVLLAFGSTLPLFAQPRVSPEHIYEHVFAVVPMVGSGRWDDPKRPQYTPNPRTRRPEAVVPDDESDGKDTRGIIEFSYVVSDDGQFALVEFVTTDLAALTPILNDHRPDVKLFRLGRTTKEEVEAEFRKHRRDFTWNELGRGAGK